MDKNAIKKYAVWARRELISRVSQRAALYEITDKGYGDASADNVLGRVMSAEEKRQRQALIAQIREKGYEQIMEEITYTWFNRFIALRFMEVNGYLPSRVRVFTDDENNFKPQILTEAINIELDGLDMEKVYALKNANDDDTLFKYMIIVQCNALSSILPGMFQHISDFTELLFPDNLLREGSVIEQMVAMIPEADWTDQVQIIGWLYQYYNTEPKDKVFADLKKNIKISKENIPAATQLFTPDWIVRYMVENSLGRLWLEGHPNDELKASWKYYLDEAEQEPDVQERLAEIRKEYASLRPEDILVIDPCQGSGHILAYMFDVLVQIYESYGYTAREAAASIVEHNIWGLDIDGRATQLSYFSLMMKARQYDRRFFSRRIQPHVFAIVESNGIDPHTVQYFVNERPDLKINIEKLITELHDAKEYGSILTVSGIDFDALFSRIDEIQNEKEPSVYSFNAVESILPLIQVGQALAQRYHTVVTNPPYMGNGNMSPKLSNYVKKVYNNGRNDLFAVFISRCMSFCSKIGYQAMITQHQWMFLSSYENIRTQFLNKRIINMAHLGARAFDEISGEVVQTTAFVASQVFVDNYRSKYIRLTAMAGENAKEKAFLEKPEIFEAGRETFIHLPGNPFVYWISENFSRLFDCPSADSAITLREGIHTGQNDLFLRLWEEIDVGKLVLNAKSEEDLDTRGTWVPYNKGGSYRKWYGNNELVIGFDKKHRDAMAQLSGHVRPSQSLYFKHGGTWSALASGKFGLRYYPDGFLFDSKGQVAVGEKALEIITLFNLKAYQILADMLMPTLDYKCGDVKKLPYCHVEDPAFVKLGQACIDLAKEEYDNYETSWGFKVHPLVKGADGKRFASIKEAFDAWQKYSNERFNYLLEYETELNHIFIKQYGLDSDISPEVQESDITLRRANLGEDIRSFISYAVGCMFGRYSLDCTGVVCAGDNMLSDEYVSYTPDKDNILPICDDEYFEDDIVGKFVEFVRTVYGEASLEDNLSYIAKGLGASGNPREVIRNYFINDFFRDHCSVYSVGSIGKRPIYWLFDSGKKNGFKCLIYMHRYQPDTIARIRTDYVHEQQSRYRTAIADLESRIANAGTGERVKLSKQLTKLQEQAEELRVYEEKIHHLADQMIRIDLDDGVKHNYAIFQDVLAKIK